MVACAFVLPGGRGPTYGSLHVCVLAFRCVQGAQHASLGILVMVNSVSVCTSQYVFEMDMHMRALEGLRVGCD